MNGAVLYMYFKFKVSEESLHTITINGFTYQLTPADLASNITAFQAGEGMSILNYTILK